MITNKGKYIQINKPEWFKDDDFLSCLEGEWSWYNKNTSSEYSDTVFYCEENNAGSLDHLPDYIANEIEQICKSECLTSCLIWITNLE